MVNLQLLFVCLLFGILLQRVKTLPRDAHLTLNAIILHVPLPALALSTVPQLELRADLIWLPLSCWLIFLVSCAFFAFVGKQLSWHLSVIGCLTLTAGLGNTAFVGFPLIEALLGSEALKLAVFLDQPGSFLIVSSVAIYVAVTYSAGEIKNKELVKRIIFFPPFLAFTLSVVLGICGWRAEGETEILLKRLASLLTPLALMSVGLQLKFSEIKHDLNYLVIGLGFKLLLAPTMIFGLYYFLNLEPILMKVAVLESAMAPMITASILASSHGLHPRLAGSMVGFGVPLSFLTVAIWQMLLSV